MQTNCKRNELSFDEGVMLVHATHFESVRSWMMSGKGLKEALDRLSCEECSDREAGCSGKNLDSQGVFNCMAQKAVMGRFERTVQGFKFHEQ
jgi:hypothetical protein